MSFITLERQPGGLSFLPFVAPHNDRIPDRYLDSLYNDVVQIKILSALSILTVLYISVCKYS